MFYCYFLQDFELLSEKSCKHGEIFFFFFDILLFLFINLFFMIVKFCTYQFIKSHKFLNVGPRK